MNPKTELLLYQMLWAASRVVHPSPSKLTEGFEAWAYRQGFLRQIRRLEEAGYVESRQTAFDGTRLHRLTEAGRLAALGGRDPEAQWSTPWDRKWRLFLFDIPEAERSLRRRLTRTLAAAGCGCLQGSVWIAPHIPPGLLDLFPKDGADCSHLLALEAQSEGKAADRRMVQGAWDFAAINERYERHLQLVRRFPKGTNGPTAAALAKWAEKENAAWLEAIRSDPLLPSVLLPKGYLGRKAWKQRKALLPKAGQAAARLSSPGSRSRRGAGGD